MRDGTANLLAGIAVGPRGCGVATVDLSTGSFATTQIDGVDQQSVLWEELIRLSPSEIVYPESLQTESEFIRDKTSEALSMAAALFVGRYETLDFESQVRVGGEGEEIAFAELVSPVEANLRSGVPHSFNTPDVCDIAVYEPLDDLDLLPFFIAFEIAGCMELMYFTDTFTVAARWWQTGIANWAATMTFPGLAT